MEAITMTELELSNWMIEQGENGKEQTSKEWKNNGFLDKGKNTYKSFMKKVNQYFEVVDCKGRGNKRTYTLIRRDEVIKHVPNYKGDISTQDEILIKEYIFNGLVKYIPKKHRNITKNGWIKAVNLPNDETINNSIVHVIKNFYSDKTTQRFNENMVVSKFKNSVVTKSLQMFKLAIEKLAKEERISFKNVYIASSDSKFITLDDKVGLQIDKEITAYLKENNIDRAVYNYAIKSSEVKYSQIKDAINKLILDEYGFDYIFKTYDIKILDNEIKDELNISEFNYIFFTKLLKTEKTRQENQRVKGSTYFYDRFTYINALLIVKELGFADANFENELSDQLLASISEFNSNIDEVLIHYNIEKAYFQDTGIRISAKELFMDFEDDVNTLPNFAKVEVDKFNDYVESMLPFK